MSNKALLIYMDTLSTVIDELDDASLGQLFRGIYRYQESGEILESESSSVRIAFGMIKKQMDRDNQKYEAKVQKRIDAANARWSRPNPSTIIQQSTSVSDFEEVTPESPPPESPPKPPARRFVRPSLQEVTDYFAEKNQPLAEAESFYNYYESNGWRVGKNPMKNWHAACNNWFKNINTHPSNGHHLETSFDLQQRSSQQLRQAVAADFAAKLARERAGEDQYVPIALRDD